MRQLIYILFFLGSILQAQVSIGKQEVSSPNALLEFGDEATNYFGIILPSVTNTTAISMVNGTFIYDVETQKVRMYEDGSWIDLSARGNATAIMNNPSDENPGSTGVIIGADSSTAQGVLVLESSDKALVLPKIANPHTTVENPYPGMICYDTASKSLAVFDGSNWNYWK